MKLDFVWTFQTSFRLKIIHLFLPTNYNQKSMRTISDRIILLHHMIDYCTVFYHQNKIFVFVTCMIEVRTNKGNSGHRQLCVLNTKSIKKITSEKKFLTPLENLRHFFTKSFLTDGLMQYLPMPPYLQILHSAQNND